MRRLLTRVALALCLGTGLLTACDWPGYHKDPARSGVAPVGGAATHLTTAWTHTLDGQVYASPLVVGGTVIVATENDTLYGFSTTGTLRWSRHLYSPVRLSDLAGRGAPCGNIDPLGITGTPIYDPATSRLFAVAETLVNGDVAHMLVALDPATGAVLGSRDVVPPRGNVAAHQQRAALALSSGRVYVAFGGLAGDCGDYVGSVVGIRTDLTGTPVSFAVPTAREGGIWTPPGPTVAPDGTLLVTAGNGEATSGTWDGSDSVTRLHPDLSVADRFAPATWGSDNAADLDLGSTGPVLTANGFVLQVGKRGVAYTLDAAQLGGIGGQRSSATICASYGGAAVSGSTVYLPCSDGVRRVDVLSTGVMSVRWHGTPAGSPVVYGTTVLSTSQANGELYSLDAATGRTVSTLPVGALTRFATPALDAGRAYVGTTTGIVAVNLF